MDCTVISVYPMPIEEYKPGLQPDLFKLAGCKNDNEPSILRVGNATDRRFVAAPEEVSKSGCIDVPVFSEVVAKSIVMDFRMAAPFASDVAYPGLYYVEGTPSAEQIVKSAEHRAACNAQMLWFMRIVKEADDIWQKHKQHRFINDIMRIAATRLNLVKEWNTAPEDIKTIKCVACQQFVSSDAIVCSHCNVVLQPEKYKNLTFAK